MENRAFKEAGIRNLIKKNYEVSLGKIDLHAEIDDTISMAENWNNIKPKVILLCEKQHKCMFGE